MRENKRERRKTTRIHNKNVPFVAWKIILFTLRTWVCALAFSYSTILPLFHATHTSIRMQLSFSRLLKSKCSNKVIAFKSPSVSLFACCCCSSMFFEGERRQYRSSISIGEFNFSHYEHVQQNGFVWKFVLFVCMFL